MSKRKQSTGTDIKQLKSAEKFLKKSSPDEKVQLSELVKKYTLPAVDRLLKSYPEEIRDDLRLTRAQIVQLLRFSQDRVYGMATTVPLSCKAADCDFADICMYQQFGIAPEGHPCPEEVDIIMQIVPQLIRELEVDEESFIEINMVQEYVDSIIQEHRAQKYTARTNAIVPVTIGYDPASGIELTQDSAAPSIELKERAMRKKEKLRKELLATREMQARYKKGNTKTAAERAAALRKRQQQALAQEDDIQEGEYEDIEEN